MPSTAQDHQTTLERLTEHLSAGAFPDKLRPQATRLRDVLSTPRRVTLMGPAGSEQTHVLNLLAGDEVLPNGRSLGTVRVSHGAQERTRLTLSDGSTLVIEGLPSVSALGGVKPVLTEVEAPLPSLAKISLMDLADAGEPSAQAKALAWAAKQTEIAIWCTREFRPEELALWQTMPDEIQDHAMVVCTDHRSLGGARADATAALRAVAENSFAYYMALDPIAARRASMGESIDKEMLRASGGMQLISSILKEIGQVQQDAIDQAVMLLVRAETHGHKPTLKVRPKGPKATPKRAHEDRTPVAVEVQAAEAPETGDGVQATKEPAAAKAPPADAPAEPAPSESIAKPAQAEPTPERKAEASKQARDPVPAKPRAPAAPQPLIEPEIFPSFELKTPEATAKEDDTPEPVEPTAPVPEPLPEALAAAFTQGIKILEDVGRAHHQKAAPEEAVLLRNCSDALVRLEETLLEASACEHDALGQIERMTQDASDLVQLLRLEAGGPSGSDAGLEAVSVLLQLKRVLQEKVSA